MPSFCISIWKRILGRGRRDLPLVSAGTDSHLPSMPPPPPSPEPQWPIPTFNVRIEDLAHPGAKIFLDNIRADEALRHAVTTVCRLLYTEQTVPREYALAFTFAKYSVLPPFHLFSCQFPWHVLILRSRHRSYDAFWRLPAPRSRCVRPVYS